MTEQSTHKKKPNLQSGISENTNMNQVLIQIELESINLSATNGTFSQRVKLKVTF